MDLWSFINIMKRLRIVFSLLLLLNAPIAISQTYLEKFQKFMLWNNHLPATPSEDFIEFIRQTTPLSQKLRGQWMYQLAQRKDWKTFLQYYQPSNDLSLQCYEQLALINQGQAVKALPKAKALWLQSISLPPSCNALFDWLLKTQDPQQDLITQRIRIALEDNNLSLANYLLNEYRPPHRGDSKLLYAIHQKPTRIADLTPGPLHGDFYLYGLKRLILTNMDEAVRYWEKPKARQLLNEKQNQSFLSTLVIYKAIRNSKDTAKWFSKIKPQYYTDLLLDWEIRYALGQRQWKSVEQLIRQSPQKNEPCWQYWLARSLAAQRKTTEAEAIYQTLSKTRHYYGFLASIQLKTTPSFVNETTTSDLNRLHVYQSITSQIQSLYNSHQITEASRLTNDFASELPKPDKSAFILWIEKTLNWHGKAVYLSETDDLINQLSLRFPLTHQKDVSESAKHFQIQAALIYAIIRQESGFRKDAVSPAGAKGLMQLLPSTAQKIAKEQKITLNKNQLFSCVKNITLGAAYLQQLDKRFHHHPILMAAAYNAGPTQVNYWLKNHTPKQIDIWIETLPWRETRNYLKNIIAFYAVYQYRMHTKGDLSLFMKKW